MYSVVAQQTLRTTIGDETLYPYIWGTRLSGNACTERATLHSAWFQAAALSPGSLVATASTGTAIRFLGGPEYAWPPGEVDGDVVTGGGAVNGTSARGWEYGLYGIIDTKYFIALSATPGTDFSLLGRPGLLYVAPVSLAAISAGLYLLLTKTRFGIAMRASVENPSLARVLGIDVERTYVFAWWLAGGFAALSGSYYSLWLPGGTSAGSNLIVEIFAASVLGGLASIYGAALGGLIVGASEILLTQEGAELFGSWVQIYQKGVPLVIMVVTLLLFPQGLVSVRWRRIIGSLAQNFRLIAIKVGQNLRSILIRLRGTFGIGGGT